MNGDTPARYKILQKLGIGGQGEVYLAEDLELGRRVGLKFMKAGTESDLTARARFTREAKAAAAIDHPFVCKIYEVSEIDGRPYIAMEYLEGLTLRQRMDSGRLPWLAARPIVLEISEALIKAHERGIVHGDLKPANVMEVADGHIKVLDFGLATRCLGLSNETISLTEDSDTGMIAGTIPYMAPEQLRGSRVDGRSDLFSLGIIFYELLTGFNPFRRPSVAESMHAIFDLIPEPVSQHGGDCPREIDAVIARMLEKEPANRYRTVREFRADLTSGSTSLETLSHGGFRPPVKSIAVLPFVNMSAELAQEYFSDGITEDLTSEISKIPGLKVIARTSVMALKNAHKDLAVIGQELGVKNVMEGSVRQAGNRVRITCALVDVTTKEQIWSEVYDRDLTDILGIQSEVARQIAARLSDTLSHTTNEFSTIPPQDAEAYQLYLKARFYMNKATPEGIERAIRLFRQVVAKDPRNARAYAGLSNCYAVAGHWDFIPPKEAAQNAKTAAQKALALDGRLAEAYTSLGMALLQEWDWKGCDQNFRRAIELNPNSVDARVFYSWYLCMAGRFEDALYHAEHAVEVDPLSSFVGSIFSWVLILAGQFDEAIRRLEEILEIDPSFTMAQAELAHAYVGKEMYDEAVKHIEKSAWRKALYLIPLAFAGRLEEAGAQLNQLVTGVEIKRERPSEIALVYLMLGDRAKAAEWLEKAFEARDYMIAMHTCGEWVPQRGDPLVQEYLRRLDLPHETVH
jgi:serine/threonine protein kinase/Flp pilus assembly protein TadD